MDVCGEYPTVAHVCKHLGIQIRVSCPYTSAQNGCVERKHRHLIETGFTMLAQASMPLSFWWYAFQTIVFLINGLPFPSPVLQDKSPMEVLLYSKLDVSSLKIFGSVCYPNLRPYQSHKFDVHSVRCVYLGPSPIHKGHRCLTTDGKLLISRHVRFNENDYPFKTGFGLCNRASTLAQSAPSILS